jgi:formylglycine-generating enzyme required for sulfatase activity
VKNKVDPKGAVEGSYRVLRGGGWGNYPWHLRSARRDYYGPGFRYSLIGFRLVRTANVKNKVDPKGAVEGSIRVLRGGGWSNYPLSLRSARRGSGSPGNRNSGFGFRLVRTANALPSSPVSLDPSAPEAALMAAKTKLERIKAILEEK